MIANILPCGNSKNELKEYSSSPSLKNSVKLFCKGLDIGPESSGYNFNLISCLDGDIWET